MSLTTEQCNSTYSTCEACHHALKDSESMQKDRKYPLNLLRKHCNWAPHCKKHGEYLDIFKNYPTDCALYKSGELIVAGLHQDVEALRSYWACWHTTDWLQGLKIFWTGRVIAHAKYLDGTSVAHCYILEGVEYNPNK